MPDLEPRQVRFCHEYIIDLNATKAALRAGYSSDSARQIGSENLSKPSIQELIEQLNSKVLAKIDITAEQVIREAARIAMVDIGGIFDENGKLRPIKEIPEDVRRAISAVEVEELLSGGFVQVGWTKKIKFWDKVKSLELVGKHFKLFSDRVELSADDTLAALFDKIKNAGKPAE